MEDSLSNEQVVITEAINDLQTEAQENINTNTDNKIFTTPVEMNNVILQKRYSRVIKIDKDEQDNKKEYLINKNNHKNIFTTTSHPQELKDSIRIDHNSNKNYINSHDINQSQIFNIDSNYNTATNNLNNESSNGNNINLYYGSNPSNQFAAQTEKLYYSNYERKKESDKYNHSMIISKISYRNLHFETLDKYKKKIHFNKYRTLNIQIKPNEKELYNMNRSEFEKEKFLNKESEKEADIENNYIINQFRQGVRKSPAFVYSSHNTHILKRDKDGRMNKNEMEKETDDEEEVDREDRNALFEVKNNYANKISRFIIKSKEEKEAMNANKKRNNKNKTRTIPFNSEDEAEENIADENDKDDLNEDEEKSSSKYMNKNEDSDQIKFNRDFSAMRNKTKNLENDINQFSICYDENEKENEDELSQDQDILTEEEVGDIKWRGGIVILKPNLTLIKGKELLHEENFQHNVELIHPNKLYAKDLLQITFKRIERCARLIQITWRNYKFAKIYYLLKIQSYWRGFRLRNKFIPVLYYYYILRNKIHSLQNFIDKRSKKIAFYRIFCLDNYEMYCDSLEKLRCQVLYKRGRKKEYAYDIALSGNDFDYNPITEISVNIKKSEINLTDLDHKHKVILIPRFNSQLSYFAKSYKETHTDRACIRKIQKTWRNMSPFVKIHSSTRYKLSNIRNVRESDRIENFSCIITPKVSRNPKYIIEKAHNENTIEFLNSSNISNMSIASKGKKSNYSDLNLLSSKWNNINSIPFKKINIDNQTVFTKTYNNLHAIRKNMIKIQRFVRNKLDMNKKKELNNNYGDLKELRGISKISENIELSYKPITMEKRINIGFRDINEPIIYNNIRPLYISKVTRNSVTNEKFESKENTELTEDLEAKTIFKKELLNENMNNNTNGGEIVNEEDIPKVVKEIITELETPNVQSEIPIIEENNSYSDKNNPIDMILGLKSKFEATRKLNDLLSKSFKHDAMNDLREYQLNDVAKQLFSILVIRKRMHLLLNPEYLLKIKRRIMLIDFIFTFNHQIINNSGQFIFKKLKKHSENEKQKEFLENLYRQMHMEYMNSIQTFMKVDKDELEMQVEIQVEDDLLNYGYNLYKNKKNREDKKWYQSPEMSLAASLESRKVEELKDSMNESQSLSEKKNYESCRKNNKMDFIRNSLRMSHRSREEAKMKSISENIDINFSY